MTDEDQPYNLAAIRKLLLVAFTAEELRRFCHDRPVFRPAVAQFGPGQGLDDIADEVITYGEKRALFALLLAAVKEENPNQYARFEPQLLAAAAPSPLPGAHAVRDPAFYLRRGVARYEAGDAAGAIADYTQAIILNPYDAPAYNNRGLARETQGDLAGAIADYTQAIALEPDALKRAPTCNNRGNARAAQGDWAGAIADYTQAIALNPRHLGAYNNRALAREAQGDLAGAIADYTQAIPLDPAYAAAHKHRSLAREAQDDLTGAIADLTTCLGLTQDPDKRAEVEEYLKELRRKPC